MRTLPLIASLALTLLLRAGDSFGQMVGLDVKPQHSEYVLGEPVLARLTVVNHSSRPIVIGEHEAFRDNRLVVDIKGDAGSVLPQRRPGSVVTEMDITLDETFREVIDLGDWYPLHRVGRYYAEAVLYHDSRRYVSSRRMFDIVPGIELAQLQTRLVGQPGSERRFILVYWPRQEQELAFLRAHDEPGGVMWTTLPLGTIVRVNPPDLRVDEAGNIQVVHQSTRDTFVTSTIRSDTGGPVLIDQKRRVDTSTTPLVHAMSEGAKREREKRAGRTGKDRPAEAPRSGQAPPDVEPVVPAAGDGARE